MDGGRSHSEQAYERALGLDSASKKAVESNLGRLPGTTKASTSMVIYMRKYIHSPTYSAGLLSVAVINHSGQKKDVFSFYSQTAVHHRGKKGRAGTQL